MTIPARSAGGVCSPSPVDYIAFEGRVLDTNGVAGIYVMPKNEFDVLAAASNSQSSAPVNFKYYNEISCAGGKSPVSSCIRSSALNGNETICVVFINQQSTSTQVDVKAAYKLVGKSVSTSATTNRANSDESLSITSITIISVAGFLGVVVILVLTITVCRRVRDRRRAKFDAVFERPGPILQQPRPRMDHGYTADGTEISYGSPLLLSNGPPQDPRTSASAPYMMGYPPHFMPPPPTSYESYAFHPNMPHTPPLPMTAGTVNPYNPYMVSFHAPVANSGHQHFQ